MINSWDELYKEFSMHRDEMTKEQELEFVSHCFRLYEQEGFAKKFWSQGGDFEEYQGKPFSVVGHVTEEEADLECLPMWLIRFQNGDELNVYPDEIIPSEMKANGCKLEGI